MYLRFLQEAPPSCSADTEWLELSTNLKSSVLDHMAKCTMSSIYNKCNYAAKFIYKHLLEPDFPTNRQKFDVNCKNLKSLSHTCIVRYIDIIIDHDTRLPVLIMELRDKNLTEFLKQYSSKPLPYHVELNIGLDIAQALQYLHGHVPKILHSNLTSNNIFVVTGPRVKVCNFGMSTLGFAKPKESPCPEYKSPEALNKPPTLSEKLDVFSFGVLLLQILTRLPPNPTDRFRAVPDNAGNIIEISETDRRSDHLGRIAEIHPLKPTILRCLENADRHRPTAAEFATLTLCKDLELWGCTEMPGSALGNNSDRMHSVPRACI